MSFVEVPFKRLLARNDGGVWGEDPTDVGDTFVLRSTDQTAGGEWSLDNPAQRSITISDVVRHRLEVGDLLVTKSSGSDLHIGKTTIVGEHVAALGAVYSNFMQRLRLLPNCDPRFYWYVLSCKRTRGQWMLLSTTSTGLANLSAGTIGNLLVPKIALREQRQIAEYLDRETGQIDALIAKQGQLVETLTERRQAVIAQAVTRGLDHTEDLLPTGLRWLTEVPATWRVVPSHRIFFLRATLARPSDLQLTASQKYGIVSQTEFTERSGGKVVEVVKGASILKHVEPGDFVISMRSFQGGLEWSSLQGSISSAYVMLRPGPGVHSDYYRHLFKSRPYIAALQNTSNLVRDGQALRFDNFKQVHLPLPPAEEQRAIADYIRRECAQIDALIAKAREMTAVLRERRRALISAAVTGKIDVRGL